MHFAVCIIYTGSFPIMPLIFIFTEVNRLQAQTWCIDNDFELVELNPETDSDSDMEDDFLETTGVSRIVQALQAHTWSNLKMRGKCWRDASWEPVLPVFCSEVLMQI